MGNDVKIKDDVLIIAQEISDLKGLETLALDLSTECSWTSFFIVTTCSSKAHLKGLVNTIRSKLHDFGYSIKQNRKNHGDSGWVLLDCSDFVIHFMIEKTRDYYDIEGRWKKSEIIYSSSKLS